MGYRVIGGKVYPVGNFPVGNSSAVSIEKNKNTSSFDEILKSKLKVQDGFTISKHAAERLQGTNFSSEDMNKINEGINKAQEKGSKNCLILYKDVALVTSVANRTVITAVNGERIKDNVFTNIDSVVML